MQVITTKYGVLCKNKHMLWFCAKQTPTCGVICYFLCGIESGSADMIRIGEKITPQIIC
jgi:hypothetical protein